MKIIADENIDRLVVERLREYGFDVIWITEINPAAKDPVVLAQSFETNSLLLTKDKDFGELIFRRHLRSNGVLLLRIKTFDLERISVRIRMVLERSGPTLLSKFSVLTDGTLRTVPLPKNT
ncbi:MAG TPA: DUF5615 family PIN-like protein [Candidatus Kapabacteria bacterium]|jgi:predicted nuclease of predicted toxin-antitoxin system